MSTIAKFAIALSGIALTVIVTMSVMPSEGSSKHRVNVTEERLVPSSDEESAPVEHFSVGSPGPAVVTPQPSPEQPVNPSAERDQTAELATTLEAEYTVDARPTREASRKESILKDLFSGPELEGKGALQEIDCRENYCRGVVRIANEQLDNQVFASTFLSDKFATAIPDAITVASRQKMQDGTVLATFFLHPQSVSEMLEP